VVEIARMQELLRYVCENGFEHHVAASPSQSAAAVHEATTKYLGWSVFRHES
jgi:L-fucose isomerase-like protein